MAGISTSRLFALGHVACASECTNDRCSGNESSRGATLLLLLSLSSSAFTLREKEQSATVILLTQRAPLSVVGQIRALCPDLLAFFDKHCVDISIEEEYSLPNQLGRCIVHELKRYHGEPNVHVDALDHRVAKRTLASLRYIDVVARQLPLFLFASIPGELLVPKFACVDEIVDNPVVFVANLKLNSLLDLP